MTICMYLGAYALTCLIVAATVGFISRDVTEMLFYFLMWPLIIVVLGYLTLWSIWTTRVRRDS